VKERKDLEYKEITEQRAALMQIYSRYQFAREELDGSYHHDASFKLIVQRAQPVLTAMRRI
jgi:hypothetical protein